MFRLLLFIAFTTSQLFASSQVSVINSRDSCITNYFNKFYNNASLELEPASMVMDNNSIITCGLVRLSNPNDASDGYLMKVDANGRIVWQKTFGGDGSQGLRTLIKLADGNFIASGVNATATNIQYYLLKFDTNGTVLWQKDFGTTNKIESISVSDIAEDVNGDLIITGLNLENDPFAHFRILFARFDKFGNITQSRFYVPPYDAYSALMFPNSCIIKDGYTYIAGNVMVHSLKGLLMKINNASGNLEWSKIYDFNNGEANFSQAINYSDTMLCLIGVNNLNPVDTSIIYLTDTSGKPSSVKYFRFPNLNNAEYGIYGKAMLDDDKNLIWTMRNRSTEEVSSLTISKVNPLNGVIWAKNYKELINLPRPIGIRFGPDSSIYTGGYNGGPTRQFRFYLSKLSKDGELGCAPGNLETSFGNGVSSFKNLTFTPDKNKSLIQKNGSYNIVGNYLSLTDSSCTISNLCTNIKLSAPGRVCDISDTIKLKVIKNNKCILVPKLEFDTSKIKLLSSSDSVAKFMAFRPGSFLIKASLRTSCETFKDSVVVNIAPPASMLDLGRDTTLCTGDTMLLRAGGHFASYQWQDGSTDSLFIARGPGKYFVTITDYCGISKTDTITLSPAAAVSLNFLPLYTKCGSDTISLKTSSRLNKFSFEPAVNIKYSNSEIKAWPGGNVNFSIKATTDQGCPVTDSLKIKVNNPTGVYLPNDTTICEGNSMVIKAPDGFNNYWWSDGSHLKVINVSRTGTFWLNVIDTFGCSSRDTILVTVKPKPALYLGRDTAICPEEVFVIKPAGNFVSYLWQDGTATISFSTGSLGTYWVRVTDNAGCTNADTINITSYKSVPVNFLKKIDSVCIFSPKNIYSSGNWAAYLWSNGMRTSFITVTNPGSYTLQVTNGSGCSAKDTIQVINAECIQGIWFPSAFSPNDDGKNDVFKPIVHMPVSEYYFEIYNRYGQQIFRETNPSKGWDGRFKLELQNPGAYIWHCVYSLQGQEKTKQTGTVVLIR